MKPQINVGQKLSENLTRAIPYWRRHEAKNYFSKLSETNS